MSTYILVLTVIGSIVLLFSLIYTFMVARNQKALKGTNDTDIPDQVEEHPYIRNPIFWTYIIFIGLLLAFVIYFALTIPNQ
ncbi:hypothetical protein [Aeribacillus pallidus]|uniref:hypothetical protein n=1 Tax=Aeribacillus pallidus TaxID=33936 RepID=UPI001D82FFBC|nr:hypothetical protein [Bacillus sp. (in: firmicutes)]